MASLEFAGDNGSLSDINATQGEFRSQIAALTDMVKQIAGNAAVSAGDSAQADPLNAPFTLYVNPYTGSDEFVGGSYNDYETGVTQAEIIESKLKRLEKQRLTCGFTPQRPFKTINRAVIEAAIITSKDWYTITDPAAHVDCVSIVLSAGVHTLYNDPGQASTSIASWGAYKNPTTADLIQFNPATVGGVLLPRGCSLCGPDLRKTTIRPNWVPAVADEAADYSNRHGMLKITGTGYFFGHTVMDKIGLEASHHLLDAYQFTSKAELDDFYAKTFSAVGSGADLASALTVTRGTEYQIVGPIDQTQTPTAAWDTISSASPYIFNVSIRSNYGMGGAFMDGSKVEGLKSMVCANFTGVSLQKDMSCWQIYNGSSWVQPTYEQYIAADPDNTRMNPARLSRHISAINDAFIQEVSVFAIGQGIHHFTDLGGEITVTNSNSSFGGCAAYSKGYKGTAFPSDTNWAVSGIRVPLDLQEKTGNIRYIYLGTTSAVTSSKITLSSSLAIDNSSSTTPAVLLQDGYSFASGTYIWIENPLGDPWYAPLGSNAWQSSAPTEIDISSAFAGNDATINTEGTNLLVNKRVYIRRLVDTRTPNERRVSILANNTASARLPQRNFIVQADPLRSNGAISREFTTTGTEIFAVSNAGAGNEAGVTTSTEFTLRRSAPSTTYNNGDFYTAGSVVRADGKHYAATRDVYAATASPDPGSWFETYVHTASDYDAEDPIAQESRQITIDTDTDTDPYSTDLSINWSSVWAGDEYRSSTDYKGVHAFLVAIGLTSSQAHAALVPQAAADRLLDPTSASDFPNAPSGGAATGRGNWAIEFRRPSTLRLYGHAWEWAGFLNYSKAIPAAQKDLGPQNAFTYYFTNEAGGRVVPQGSNENGFNITPRGLEDIETGSTLTVENIGSSNIDIAQQTEFDQLQVETLNATTINVENLNFAFEEPSNATTDASGVVELATLDELLNSPPATNANINNFPQVVTARGLSYWRTQNNFLAAPIGRQYVYVDPVNGADVNSTEDAIGNPPTSPNTAIKRLDVAANYANAVFSPSVEVEFRVGPALLNEDATFETNVILRAWDFGAGTYLNDSQAGGEEPFLGGDTPVYGNFFDVTKQPTFVTAFRRDYLAPSNNSVLIRANPCTLTFKQSGTVIGFAWLGLVDSILSSSVPDSRFLSDGNGYTIPVSEWRTPALSNPDEALNYLFRSYAARCGNPGDSDYYIYGIRQDPAIIAEGELNLENCAFGAMRPASPGLTGANAEFERLIELRSSKTCRMDGIRLYGNIKLSSESNTGSVTQDGDTFDFNKVKWRNDTADYRYTGFSQSLIGFGGGGKPVLSLALGTKRTPSPTESNENRSNFPWNNITLLKTDHVSTASIATTTGSPNNAGWEDEGPAFAYFVNVCTELVPHSYRNWAQVRVEDGEHGGFDGLFGTYNDGQGSGTVTATHYTRGFNFAEGCIIDRPQTIEEIRSGDYFREAGSGDTPDVATYISGLSAGGIGQDDDPETTTGLFADLNIKVRGYKKGVDTATGRISYYDNVF